MTLLSRLFGFMAAVIAVVALAALSHLPWHATPNDNGIVRLAWSARPEQIENCRNATAAELADRPAHMRQQVICEGTSARYHLEVRSNGALLASDTVRGGGARHDRPVYVLRDFAMPPGTFTIDVRFTRIDSAATQFDTGPAPSSAFSDSGNGPLPDRPVREAEERARRQAEAVPAQLESSWSVTLGARRVVLITYDPDQRKLVRREEIGR